MSIEVAQTVFIPVSIVMISFLAMFIIAKLKKRRTRRKMERGVSDFLRRMRS